MSTKPAIRVRAMTAAAATDNGDGVRFQLEDVNGERHTFVCHHQAAAEITDKLATTVERAARRRGDRPEPDGPQEIRVVVPRRWNVDVDEQHRMLALMLYLPKVGRVAFGFPETDAEDLAAAIGEAVARFPRRTIN